MLGYTFSGLGYLTAPNQARPGKKVPHSNVNSPGLALQPPEVPLGLLRSYLKPQDLFGVRHTESQKFHFSSQVSSLK